MKFTLNNDHQKNRSMNLLLSGLLVFVIFFLASDMIVKKEHYGYTYAQIKMSIFGDEEEFIEPLPFSSLLEGVHADIFFTMMTLLTLGAIYGRVGRSKKLSVFLINIMMLSAFFSVVSPFLVYFYSSELITLWISTFIVWHLTALFISFISLWRLKFP